MGNRQPALQLQPLQRFGRKLLSQPVQWYPFKYTRKSNNEYIFLPNPYCSIIGSTQPGMLSSLFGGKRSQNGFSSRFLKVYPDIAAMPSWNEASMPEEVLDEWERIIRQVDSVQPPAGQEGKTNSLELFFSQAVKQCLIRWKNEVNCRIYVESESEAEKALCGKLETYLIRFCLVIPASWNFLPSVLP